MTADEIRRIEGTQSAQGVRELTVQEIILREIAAQLAELNDRLQLFSVGNDTSYKSLAVTIFEEEKEGQ